MSTGCSRVESNSTDKALFSRHDDSSTVENSVLETESRIARYRVHRVCDHVLGEGRKHFQFQFNIFALKMLKNK